MSTVGDIYEAVKHRLPDRNNLYPALNSAIRLISKRLFYHKSSLVRGSLSLSVAADSASVALPSDFWGFLDNEYPYISTLKRALAPVPDQAVKLLYDSNTTPLYYERVGSTLYFYPGTASAITVNGSYWTRPTKLTKIDDEIPFDELFDDVIIESLLHIYQTGLSTGNPNDIGMLKSLIDTAVDDIAPYIDHKAPTRFTDNLGYDYMTNEEW